MRSDLGLGAFPDPVDKGLEIIAGLRGHTTGYAVPTYVIDAPGGGGKIPLLPDTWSAARATTCCCAISRDGIYRYPDSGRERCRAPIGRPWPA